MSNALLRAGHHVALQALAQRRLLHGDQRPFDVGKAVDDGLAVELQQFVLPADLEVELALQPQAVEDRLRQAGGQVEERRFRAAAASSAPRSDSRPRRSAGCWGRTPRARHRHWRWRTRAAPRPRGCRAAGRSGPTAGRASPAECASATCCRRERCTASGVRPISTASVAMFCRSVSSSGGIEARMVCDQAFLLRGVERGRGADVEALLDEIEDAGRRREIVARDAQAVLRLQHQEIGVGDADHRRQRDDLAIEAAGDRESLPRRAALRGSCPRNRSRSWR